MALNYLMIRAGKEQVCRISQRVGFDITCPRIQVGRPRAESARRPAVYSVGSRRIAARGRRTEWYADAEPWKNSRETGILQKCLGFCRERRKSGPVILAVNSQSRVEQCS